MAIATPTPTATIYQPPVIRLLDAIAAAGLDRSQLLAAAGFSEPIPGDPESRLPLQKYLRLLEIATELSGDECFAVRVGRFAGPGDFGSLSYVSHFAQTMGAAVRFTADHFHAQQDATEFDFSHDEEVARVTYRVVDPRLPGRDLDPESAFGLMVNFGRHLVAGEPMVHRIWLTRREPRHPDEFEKLLRAPVTFSSSVARIEWDASMVTMPIRGADQRLAAILEEQTRRSLAERPNRSEELIEIERAIQRALPEGHGSIIDLVARDLAMSTRTLQRRLATFGYTFVSIRDETRYRLATMYLSRADASLLEASYLLGYSDFSSFSRAFKRWSGIPPGEYAKGAAR